MGMEGYVIGDKDLVLGLSLVGIKGKIISNKKECLEVLKQIINAEDAKIIFIGEDLSTQIQSELDDIRSRRKGPLIIELPGRTKVKGRLPAVQKFVQNVLKIRV